MTEAVPTKEMFQALETQVKNWMPSNPSAFTFYPLPADLEVTDYEAAALGSNDNKSPWVYYCQRPASWPPETLPQQLFYKGVQLTPDPQVKANPLQGEPGHWYGGDGQLVFVLDEALVRSELKLGALEGDTLLLANDATSASGYGWHSPEALKLARLDSSGHFDPSIFPVTSPSVTVPLGLSVLDDGTNPPRLVYRRGENIYFGPVFSTQ